MDHIMDLALEIPVVCTLTVPAHHSGSRFWITCRTTFFRKIAVVGLMIYVTCAGNGCHTCVFLRPIAQFKTENYLFISLTLFIMCYIDKMKNRSTQWHNRKQVKKNACNNTLTNTYNIQTPYTQLPTSFMECLDFFNPYLFFMILT